VDSTVGASFELLQLIYSQPQAVPAKGKLVNC